MNCANKGKESGFDLQYLKGVGTGRAIFLKKLGICCVMDLLEFFPVNYIQRQINPNVSDLHPGDRIAITAKISWNETRKTNNNKEQLNIGISNGFLMLTCTWFSYPKHYPTLFKMGSKIWVSGILSEYSGQLQMLHPDFEIISDESDTQNDEVAQFWKSREVLPVYRLSGNLTQNALRRIIYNAFNGFQDRVQENLPEGILQKFGFMPRLLALKKMHFGYNPEEREVARKRFVFEEFFFLQLMWARHNHHHNVHISGICFENKKHYTRMLYEKLPFVLTDAQKRVLREIFADMTSDRQMSRLLQGDVGSGKTIVVLFAMLLAVENGFQAVLMAPTEILADQHFHNISTLLKGIDINVSLIKGGVYKGKSKVIEEIASGQAQIIIGTHALLQEDLRFANLGFAAVDEQHRFGVEQRAILARKDKHPDLLYLSATPIPRSLAMTVYGDLEVSVLDQLPPTRKPVTTLIRSAAKIDLVYREVLKELQKGSQVYIVCPLIEESDKVDLIDAQRLFEHIRTKVFPSYNTAILHGRMKSKEKDDIMLRFKAGEFQILVSTTVIEVGVDVPNASVMIVEHAERFGLAQLHQLRGRVGRGSAQAFCYLIEHYPISNIGRERLSTMASTTDGFVIAEKDLELRGPGEFFGLEQSGLPKFRFANLLTDQDVLKLARLEAFAIISADPELSAAENVSLRDLFKSQYSSREQLILY